MESLCSGGTRSRNKGKRAVGLLSRSFPVDPANRDSSRLIPLSLRLPSSGFFCQARRGARRLGEEETYRRVVVAVREGFPGTTVAMGLFLSRCLSVSPAVLPPLEEKGAEAIRRFGSQEK